MSETIVYLNGRFIPESQAHISIYDMGIVLGATLTEMIRTFGHKPFRLGDHIDRLFRSSHYTGIDIGLSKEELAEATMHVVGHNTECVDAEDELGIVYFVTAGEFHEYVGSAGRGARVSATVCIHTFPIPFHYFSQKLQHGAHVVTPTNRHIPHQCIDPKIKCRSRMHYFLAEQQARLADPDALCLMLDLDGNITETSGSNFLIVERGGLVSPPRHMILPGISRATVIDLAAKLGIPFEERLIQIHDAVNADEALSVTTPYAICPVTKINGKLIGGGKPGPVFARLVEAWSGLVGVDIVRQMVDGAERTRRARETLPVGG
jgi:branched-chain amino acid aminotransferase